MMTLPGTSARRRIHRGKYGTVVARAVAVFLLLLVASVEARDPAQVRKFRSENPCPVSGRLEGPCPGWVVDHMYPLCAGGLDAPENMAWQDRRASYSKDRIERELCQCKGKHVEPKK